MPNTVSLSVPGTDRGRAPGIADLGPPLLATALGVAALALRWQGADWPAQLFRIEVFRRAGFVVWNLLDPRHVRPSVPLCLCGAVAVP